MTKPLTQPARIAAATIAILAFGTIALQTTINQGGETGPFAALALLFRYFTIWSNFAAGAIMALVASGKRVTPWILFALATALTQIGVVYHGVLAADHHPVGLDWWTNLMFHTVIPLATVGWWLVNSRGDGMTWRSLPLVMIAPVIYTLFALIYGELTGFYAYFFLDLPTLGWSQLALNIMGLAAFFMLLGAALLGIRRLSWRVASGSV
ncbi:Pr6Pr family membrane protein [Altererythrobacter sp. MF3-039]|uniref:Pr6Pr family membrane protein n=1 Tax=Altererythrobacter sp. MF3-039 TaxID=3252901 RepID=UPI00390C808C